MAHQPRQSSFGGDFLPAAPPPPAPPAEDPPGRRGVDPSSVESAAGIVHRPPADAARVVLDENGRVLEGHLLWRAAIDERRRVSMEQRAYGARERFEALSREADTSMGVHGWTAELVLHAVQSGREAGLSEQEIARGLKISRSHVSRLIRREELRRRHRRFLDAGLSISYLEAVGNLDDSKQAELLSAALDEGWAMRQLERRIREDDLTARRTIGINPLLLECLEEVKLDRLVADWRNQPDEWCDHLRRVARALEAQPQLKALLVPRGSRRTA